MKSASILNDYRNLIISGILQGMTSTQMYEHFEELKGIKLGTLQNYISNNQLRSCIDEWVHPEDDIPQKDKGYINLSVEVRVIDNVGNINEAYYDSSNDIWHLAKNNARLGKIVAWQSLEMNE